MASEARSTDVRLLLLQETLGVVGAECESVGGPGALQQAHERGSLLLVLLQDAAAVRTSRHSCGHAGQQTSMMT